MLLEAAGALQISGDEGVRAPNALAASAECSKLILRAQAGDTYAFEQLMVCYQRQVLGTAGRILRRYEDAKDAAQEVLSDA